MYHRYLLKRNNINSNASCADIKSGKFIKKSRDSITDNVLNDSSIGTQKSIRKKVTDEEYVRTLQQQIHLLELENSLFRDRLNMKIPFEQNRIARCNTRSFANVNFNSEIADYVTQIEEPKRYHKIKKPKRLFSRDTSDEHESESFSEDDSIKCKKEKKFLHSEIERLQVEKNELLLDLNEEKEKSKVLETTLALKTTEVNKLLSEQADMDAQISKLKFDYAEANDERISLLKKYQSASDEINELNEKISSMTSEIESFKTTLKLKEKEVGEVTNMNIKLKEDNESSKIIISSLRKKLVTEEERIKNYEIIYNNVKFSLEETKSSCNAKILSTQQIIESLQLQCDVYREYLNILKYQLAKVPILNNATFLNILEKKYEIATKKENDFIKKVYLKHKKFSSKFRKRESNVAETKLNDKQIEKLQTTNKDIIQGLHAINLINTNDFRAVHLNAKERLSKTMDKNTWSTKVLKESLDDVIKQNSLLTRENDVLRDQLSLMTEVNTEYCDSMEQWSHQMLKAIKLLKEENTTIKKQKAILECEQQACQEKAERFQQQITALTSRIRELDKIKYEEDLEQCDNWKRVLAMADNMKQLSNVMTEAIKCGGR